MGAKAAVPLAVGPLGEPAWESIAVAYATEDGAAPAPLGAIGTRQCDIDALVR